MKEENKRIGYSSKSLATVRERERERESYSLGKRGSHGITLVALVITIIVLMILAGISLSFVLGDNGILKKAQETADAYKNASQSEQQTLQNIEDYLYGEKGGNNTGDNTTGGGGSTTDASNSISYVGYYADSDGDGIVDGIIYADLAIGGSGNWSSKYNAPSSYEYPKVTEGLKSYSVSSENHTGFGGQWTKPVLTAKKESTGTQDRFYIMSLEDFNQGTAYFWYYNAINKQDINIDDNVNNFGQGKNNTATMIAEWNKGASGTYGVQHKDDLWGIIQGKTVDDNGNITTDETKNYVSKGWFVPSTEEWATFGDMAFTKMGVMTDNYTNYGLKEGYWTSSVCHGSDMLGARKACLNGYGMSYSYLDYNTYVRLSTTF